MADEQLQTPQQQPQLNENAIYSAPSMEEQQSTENNQVVTQIQVNGVNGEVSSDILQRAMAEASADGSFDQSTDVAYTTPQIIIKDASPPVDGAVDTQTTLMAISSNADGSDGTSYTIPPGHILQTEDGIPITINENGEFVVVTNVNQVDDNTSAAPTDTESLPMPTAVVTSDSGVSMIVTNPINTITEQPSQQPNEAPGTPTVSAIVKDDENSNPLDQNDEDDAPPLGSSENPIRIIQQGNHYTSMQQLTPDQLAHIMQVLQQQQVSKPVQDVSPGSTTLFNPETNTRIVYRVIYPSELHKSSDKKTPTQTPKKIQSSMYVRGRGRGRPPGSGRGRGRPPKNIDSSSQEPWERINDDSIDSVEMSREEKELKKRDRPKTRSGRVSKPPRHMVKDYRRIHLVEWDEDYDDSDAGYSDFHEEEAPENQELEDTESIKSGDGTGSVFFKARKYKCKSCDKAYISRFHLGRHYQFNPDHGELSEDEEEDDIQSNDSFSNKPKKYSCDTCGKGYVARAGLGKHYRMFPNHGTLTANGMDTPKASGSFYRSGTESHARRKARLKELVRQCDDEELMEIVLPRLSKVITLWEFLLMKTEKGVPLKPHVPDIYKEFESLHRQIQKIFKSCLRPLSPDQRPDSKKNIVEVKNAALAESFNMKQGIYEANDIPLTDQEFHYKHQPTPGSSSMATKRTFDQVISDRMIASLKRPRFESDSLEKSNGLNSDTLLLPNNISSDLGDESYILAAAKSAAASVLNSRSESFATNNIVKTTTNSNVNAMEMEEQETEEPQTDVIQILDEVSGAILEKTVHREPKINRTEAIMNTTRVDNSVGDKDPIRNQLIDENATKVLPVSYPLVSNNENEIIQFNLDDLQKKVESMGSTDTIKIEIDPATSSNITCPKVEDTVLNDPQSNVEHNTKETDIENETKETDFEHETKETDLEYDTKETNLVANNSPDTELKAELPSNNTESADSNNAVSMMDMKSSQQFSSDKCVPLPPADVAPSETARREEETSETNTIQGHLIAPNIIQTTDGTIFIQRNDGTMMQLQSSSGEVIALETLQALVAMDPTQLQNVLDQTESS
ncbi:uncharacterized protein LOC141915156 [Tubulanus polymorphus]|uniref:uncharacterized protein LOC141915156 n=1 Tax=Tubulanus polymorphus TaxID=672921 RepID=UPI003DA5EE57